MHKLQKQSGGTLLGVIIGLVVGLCVAIVVALMISKSSAPLSNKQGRTEKVAEAAPSQAVDPNKPLYGKQDASKEAAKDFVKESSPTIVEIPTDQKAPAKADAKPTPHDSKTAADKQQKKPEAKAADNGKPAAKSDEKWTYYLQAGAYRDHNDAENARAKLALLGHEARISEMPSQGSTLYRVRIGPFGQVEAMNKVRSKLSEGGVDAAVIRIPK
ncbi:MAG: SPOR domain-containing protein [Burkholderiaceae bacterium]|nr:SPOR domain-containing protein [Burkholderiaceae bacterium]